MPITFACTCGTSLTVPDSFAGKQGKCKKCGAVLRTPGAPKAATPGPEKKADEKKPAAASPTSAAPTAVARSTVPAPAVVASGTLTDEEPDGGASAAKGGPGLRQGAVKFKCPKCQVELRVPLNLAGSPGKCVKCAGSFVSPVPEALREARERLAALQRGAAERPAPAAAAVPSLRSAFSVQKVKCSCGMTSAILGRGGADEKCPACGKALVLGTV